MANKHLNTFFISVVLPSLLAISLFVISIFALIIPSVERNIMDKKKEMISELTNTAWSLLDEYHTEHQQGSFSAAEAKEMAASRIAKMRYGEENKDYFWIIDMHPNMIMHPYRPELEDMDLSNYEDPNGVKLFIEAVQVIKRNGEGYINYMWQWKDDESKIVPKLSYVKSFDAWGWIIGTGIYLEDVKKEIADLKKRLSAISFIITLLIATILLYVIRQSLKIENKRKQAEKELYLSRQKYKSLVDASTEGTLMIRKEAIVFCNEKFARLSGCEVSEILSMKFNDLFEASWSEVCSSITDPKKSFSLETKLKCKKSDGKDVVISVSQIEYDQSESFIIVAKEISQKQLMEIEKEALAQELQSSLLLMNQPIKHFVSELVKCSFDTSIESAVQIMYKKKQNVLFVEANEKLIGVVNHSDLNKRVLAQNADVSEPIATIMSSPLIGIPDNALLYEAVLLIKTKSVSHLLVNNKNGDYVGVISYKDVANIQQNCLSYFLKEIDAAEETAGLKRIHKRLPVLVNALVESGDKTENITSIISAVSDAIGRRIIHLTLQEMGPAPCKFAFMVLGSEGRQEQSLTTDQDNAIVFEDVASHRLEQVLRYFSKFARKVNSDLNTVGYQFCRGEVMAMNPKWTQAVGQWKTYFTAWMENSEPQSILDASIFFDFRCLYGEQSLINQLSSHVNEVSRNKPVFFYNLAQSVMNFKPSSSVLSNKEVFNVKKALMPVVSFIRLYALQNISDNTNTLKRLHDLKEQNIISEELANELSVSYNYLMQLRFRFQSRSIMANQLPENNIDVGTLTEIERATLKKIFGEINNLQTRLNADFKAFM